VKPARGVLGRALHDEIRGTRGCGLGLSAAATPPQLARIATKSTMTAAVEISRSSAVPDNVRGKVREDDAHRVRTRKVPAGKNAVPNIAHRSAT